METTDTDLQAQATEKAKALGGVFALFGARSPDDLQAAVEKTFSEDNRLKLPTGDWLVYAPTRQVSKAYELLAAADSKVVVVMVRVDSYYGLYDTAVWDWIQAKRDGV